MPVVHEARWKITVLENFWGRYLLSTTSRLDELAEH